jgi:hypothetical protein
MSTNDSKRTSASISCAVAKPVSAPIKMLI